MTADRNTGQEACKRGKETVENLRELREKLEAKFIDTGLTSEEMGELWWLRSQEENTDD